MLLKDLRHALFELSPGLTLSKHKKAFIMYIQVSQRVTLKSVGNICHRHCWPQLYHVEQV